MELELEKKVEINKAIRAYKDKNSFLLSLQKQLKTNKYLTKIEFKGRLIKILSDKQYDAAIAILNSK